MDTETLEHIARNYGLGPFSQSRLQSLLNDPSFSQWASQNLHPDNLLSPSELTVYTALKSSGTISRLAASEDLTSPALPTLTPSELQSAISTLRSSTAQITSQTTTLTQQTAALSKLSTKTQQTASSRLSTSLSTTHQTITTLSTTIHQKATDLSTLSSSATSSLLPTLTSLLTGDDRLLTSLTKLTPELTTSYTTALATSTSLDQIHTRSLHLIKTIVELLRTHLDTTYLTALSAPITREEGDLSLESTEALAAEVESLYAEVVPVAQMAVQSIWIDATREQVSSASFFSLRRTAAGLRYMSDILGHLLRRISLLEPRFEAVLAHAATTNILVSATENELSTPLSPPTYPTRLTHVPPPNSTTPDPTRHNQEIPPSTALTTALTTLFITLPPTTETTTSNTFTPLLTTLQQIITTRSQKTSHLSLAAQASFESTIAHILSDSRRDIAALRASLAAEYPFGEISLVDPDMAEGLQWLAREVADVEERLREVTVRKAEGTEKREEFVATWC